MNIQRHIRSIVYSTPWQQDSDARLKDSLTNLLITSYNTQEKLPFYFRSSLARKHPEEDLEMREIVRATSAAPAYFPPKQLKYTGKLRGQYGKDIIAKYDKEIDNICRLLGFIAMEREERMAEG